MTRDSKISDTTTHETMREEIERRVAAFRDRQRRFNQARDNYFTTTVARLRDDLHRPSTTQSDARSPNRLPPEAIGPMRPDA